MPPKRTTGVTSVHEARDALGKRLRELRSAADLSGRQLAESLSWPPSKVSKLENGRQTPTDDDIRSWTEATGSEDEAEALLASLHTLEVQHAEWQRQLRVGLKPHQQEIADLDAKTRLFRAFESTFIPGLLQTAEYARYRFAQSITVFKVRNDIDEAVAARMQRQDILYRPDKRFHFVLTEAALRYRLCPPEIMLGQLDRLVSLTALPNVKLGIIGFETAYVVAPAHGFWILDADRVMVETFSAELNLAQPQELTLYSGIFDNLAAVASYGRSARTIINRVIDDLAPEAADEGS
ncbi:MULTISPECIES: helix-turn-helix transcriptional regulator [unclassified Streptomyces]|uniref:helix-turn-helix domain-containing protein n=1 Tax=unclassified Streptomyces TaxID=2593676 RepID=UPI00081E3173|nr:MULTISPECIES: helix-turn-helix transcriptional regulator [unclassified Streptomyces]MYZ34981.1 helix-turn-helix domain-containing protein [Streptomyces sp. SID4917]SCF71903.1 Helix-turn-helix domain-containing protein [Streptomyces sp. MnatMP-M17]